MDNKMLLKKDLKEKRELVNMTLDRFLPRKDEYPKDIHKAIRHTLFAGGKRLRPYLCVRTFSLFDEDESRVHAVASAIEMLHTYTLIHDDLPEIDNDDYRRGKKACHVVYGADLALLAGDSLLTYAFELLSLCDLEDKLKLKLIRELASEAGSDGLIAGQLVDIKSEGKPADKKTLEYIHHNKTARLINIAIRFGCYVGGASASDTQKMENYGTKLGLTFQIIDDILDIEGSKATLGKTIGKDEQVQKMTYPAVFGLEKSKEMAKKYTEECIEILDEFGEKAHMLKLLTQFVLTRKF